MSGHRTANVLLGLLVAVLGLGAVAWAGSFARRGATYIGRGRQPHFRLAGGAAGSFIVQFRVTRKRYRVTQLYVWNLTAACGRARYMEPDPAVGAASIRRDGTFRAVMQDMTAGARRSPITLTGRFLSRGRSRGGLRYSGRGPYRGCNIGGVWTAHVKPPPPPVQRFTGTTDQGTPVTFERMIERHRRVTRFSFGLLRATFPDGEACGPVQVATGRYLVPPFNQFSLRVRQGRFSGEFFPGGAYSIHISGRFAANDHATGTVSYADRGDCRTGTVSWSARRA